MTQKEKDLMELAYQEPNPFKQGDTVRPLESYPHYHLDRYGTYTVSDIRGEYVVLSGGTMPFFHTRFEKADNLPTALDLDNALDGITQEPRQMDLSLLYDVALNVSGRLTEKGDHEGAAAFLTGVIEALKRSEG